MTPTPPDPDPRSEHGLQGVPFRAIVEELVRRAGFAEACRQAGVSVETKDELLAFGDELDRWLT